MTRIRAALRGAAAAAAVAITGCGGDPPRADIEGSVRYRGKPVVTGTVNLIAADDLTYYGAIGLDGRYRVTGVPAGPVRVGVFSPDPGFEPPATPAMKAEVEERQRRAGVVVPPKPPKGAWVKLPHSYADPRTSGLTGEAAPPTTALDLSLN